MKTLYKLIPYIFAAVLLAAVGLCVYAAFQIPTGWLIMWGVAILFATLSLWLWFRGDKE